MRRQARISAGGALILRSASAVQVWLWLLIFVFQNEFKLSGSVQPGYLDFDNLPETNFTCEGKVIGGYYADLETSCQMFHVCTVGQQDEPMDIKFLCLNGTVFDQETRVCERVDEVDCTKSERFYSLNLELYGSTLPPISKTNETKPQTEEPERMKEENKPTLTEKPNIENHREDNSNSEYQDSTEDPVQDVKIDSNHQQGVRPTHSTGLSDHEEPVEENQEEEEIDSEDPEYDDEYSQSSPAFTTVPTTSTTRPPLTSTHYTSTPSQSSSISSVPAPSPARPTISTTNLPNSPETSIPTVDPALLSPQEFIYRHRGPGSEAISFQRQSFRPADGVYITHAPPSSSQFDHFQYESSRTVPRPGAPRPTPFVQRTVPAPFRATTLDPRDQLLRPGSSTQPSERHETSIKHKPPSYLPPLPAQRPLPFDPYYYDRKRSDDTHLENESSLAARSVAPPPLIEKQPAKLKSPPRVIVTASASVSDSNGKRLNYTVGNVVSAVKPIVPINYDDYKESDLIFDPFFLDVPKLKKNRRVRGDLRSKANSPVNLPPKLSASDMRRAAISLKWPSKTKHTSKVKTSSISTPTAAWNPNDYVDDNYEPQSYIPPEPPITILLPQDKTKHQTEEKPNIRLKESKNSYSEQSSSSQSAAGAPHSPQEISRLPRADALPLHL